MCSAVKSVIMAPPFEEDEIEIKSEVESEIDKMEMTPANFDVDNDIKSDIDIKIEPDTDDEMDLEFDKWLKESVEQVEVKSEPEDSIEIKEEPEDLGYDPGPLDRCLLENKELKQQLKRILEENESLQSDLRQALSNNNDFETGCNKCKRNSDIQMQIRKKLESKAEFLSGEVERLQDDLDTCMADRKELQAEVESLRNSRARLQMEFTWNEEDRKHLSEVVECFRTSNVRLRSEVNLLHAGKDGIKIKVNGRDRIDVWWLLEEIDLFKFEKDQLEQKLAQQQSLIGRLQADLNHCMADKAIYKSLARPCIKDKFGPEQTSIQCQLEKRQLQNMLARYRLDVEMLESKARRHEADKKYAETMSALLKARLEAAVGRQFVDYHDYCGIPKKETKTAVERGNSPTRGTTNNQDSNTEQ